MYNKTDKISEHFTVEEITSSPTADKYKIDNTPSVIQWSRIKILFDTVVEPARVALAHPFQVNSVFRSQKLNERVKGAGTSQHLANNGAAADLELPSLGNKILFDYFYNSKNFDQLIWEYGDAHNPDWVHVSYISDRLNRKQVLQCVKDKNGNPKYINYKK